MIEMEIPGGEKLTIQNLLLDYNGTLARDGEVLPGVREKIQELSRILSIHVITADTFGSVTRNLEGWPITLEPLSPENQSEGKRICLERLGARVTGAVGNGANDSKMVADSVLGIALIQEEGCATETLLNSRIVCRSILDALDLFLNPSRLKASLRR